jgi:hypothetical protein
LSISDLAQLSRTPPPAGNEQVRRCTVVKAPASRTSSVLVVPHGDHGQWPEEVVARHWQSVGSAFPRVGDQGVLLTDSVGDHWLASVDTPYAP